MSAHPDSGARAALAAALAGLSLGLCYRNPGLFPLAWVGLTPLLVAMYPAGIGRAYWLGTLFGWVWQATASSWVATFLEAVNPGAGPKTLALAALYWLVCAQMFGLLMALLQWLRWRAGLDYRWTLPVFGALAFESLPQLFPVALGATQVRFSISLQALDLTGALGITALMLFVNATVCAVVVKPSVSRRSIWMAMMLPGLWFGYGLWAQWHWRARVAQLPVAKVGLVQADVAASVTPLPPESGYGLAYSPERELFEQLARHAPALVLWSEARYRGYFEYEHVRQALQASVVRNDTPLLLQDLDTRGERHYNSAILLQPGREPQQYSKRALIPFGEYVPPPLPEWVGRTLLGPFFTPLAEGSQTPLMEMPQFKWLALICYEIAVPDYVARSIKATGYAPQWISVQSNDAWFGESPQPQLHVAVSQLRAIEHRLTVVHVLNNGPSTVIEATGRVSFQGHRAQRRGYLVSVPVAAPQQTTFYNRHPDLTRNLLALMAVALLLHAAGGTRQRGGGRRGGVAGSPGASPTASAVTGQEFWGGSTMAEAPKLT